MKVDFTKFPLFTGIDRQDMVIADIRKDIGDAQTVMPGQAHDEADQHQQDVIEKDAGGL